MVRRPSRAALLCGEPPVQPAPLPAAAADAACCCRWCAAPLLSLPALLPVSPTLTVCLRA
jgi:hypothetical protein